MPKKIPTLVVLAAFTTEAVISERHSDTKQPANQTATVIDGSHRLSANPRQAHLPAQPHIEPINGPGPAVSATLTLTPDKDRVQPHVEPTSGPGPAVSATGTLTPNEDTVQPHIEPKGGTGPAAVGFEINQIS